MTRTTSIALLAALVAIICLAAVSRGAAPDAWAAYEAQVETDCRAALEQQGLAISARGDVAHGSDDVGSFMMFAAGDEGRSADFLCHAPRGEGALEVEIIELPPSYQVSYPEPQNGFVDETPDLRDAPTER